MGNIFHILYKILRRGIDKVTKGQKTREILISIAKEEFKENGYNNTSLKSIALRAGVSPSLYSYHFQNLQSLVEILTRNFRNRIWEAISKKNISNPMIKLFAYDIFVDIATYFTPENRRFKSETVFSHQMSMYSVHSLAGETQEVSDDTYYSILEYYNVNLSYELLRRLRIQEAAGRRELFLKYYNDSMYEPLTDDEWFNLSVDISYCTITTVFRFSGIATSEIDKCFVEAFNYIKDVDMLDFVLL